MKERTGEELFLEYKKRVEDMSSGKYEGTELDFVKQYAFYLTVTYPMIQAYAEAITGVKTK